MKNFSEETYEMISLGVLTLSMVFSLVAVGFTSLNDSVSDYQRNDLVALVHDLNMRDFNFAFGKTADLPVKLAYTGPAFLRGEVISVMDLNSFADSVLEYFKKMQVRID